MLLPITFGIDPIGALIMLAGIYYGAQYGGSTTAILVNIPGEATSVVTTLDGHQMAKQGRAGVALGIAAIGSFIAGCVATVIIAALAAPLTAMALLFGPADYFALMVLGLMFAVVLARGSVAKAHRHHPGRHPAVDRRHGSRERRGAPDVRLERDRRRHRCRRASPWACSASPRSCATSRRRRARDVIHAAIGTLLPNRQDFKQSAAPIARGTFLGSTPWSAAGQWRGARPLCVLHAREEARQGPLSFRAGRHRGRGRAGVGQQCRRADRLHSRCSRSASRPTP